MEISRFQMIFIFIVTLLNVLELTGGQQGIPPGVPPQHYQQHQQMPQQMQHQMPVQQQHVPVQQMQHVPVQQMQPAQQMQPGQHQVPMQQVPMQAQHIPQQQIHMQQGQPHAHHGGQPQVLNVANIAQEKQHIAEHLSVPIDTSKMSEQELQFHYFKMHDADNNNKLDGCELIKSLIHWHEQGHGGEGKVQGVPPQERLFKDDELSTLIDPILAMDDSNNDGYIDYPEFVRAQQKAAATNPGHSPK